jgi:F0F1-type ATP synthase assembly protein I
MNSGEPANGQPKIRTKSTAASLVVIGSELVAPALLGVVIDQVLGMTPWLTIIGTLLGAGLAAWHGYTILTRDESSL